MIGFIRGKVILIDGNEVIVEAGQSGVGYRLFVATRNLETMNVNDDVELHVYTQVREDAIELYGFKTRDERKLFTLLISSVKGVGAKLAMTLLDCMTPAELQVAVLSGDVATLKKVPGIGAKVADRLVLELQKTLESFHFTDSIPEIQLKKSPTSLHEDTRSALRNFGFADADIERVLQKLDESGDELDVQGEIRWALKNMNN